MTREYYIHCNLSVDVCIVLIVRISLGLQTSLIKVFARWQENQARRVSRVKYPYENVSLSHKLIVIKYLFSVLKY